MNTAQALHFDDPVSAEPAQNRPEPCTTSRIMVTTEGRMTRAGMNERERAGHKRAIGRVARDIGADAGMAVRRSVEVFAELRRVLGPDAPQRA